jgi:hypothetical protein
MIAIERTLNLMKDTAEQPIKVNSAPTVDMEKIQELLSPMLLETKVLS